MDSEATSCCATEQHHTPTHHSDALIRRCGGVEPGTAAISAPMENKGARVGAQKRGVSDVRDQSHGNRTSMRNHVTLEQDSAAAPAWVAWIREAAQGPLIEPARPVSPTPEAACHSRHRPLKRGRPRLPDPLSQLPDDATVEERQEAKKIADRREKNRVSATKSRRRTKQRLAEAQDKIRQRTARNKQLRRELAELCTEAAVAAELAADIKRNTLLSTAVLPQPTPSMPSNARITSRPHLAGHMPVGVFPMPAVPRRDAYQHANLRDTLWKGGLAGPTQWANPGVAFGHGVQAFGPPEHLFELELAMAASRHPRYSQPPSTDVLRLGYGRRVSGARPAWWGPQAVWDTGSMAEARRPTGQQQQQRQRQRQRWAFGTPAAVGGTPARQHAPAAPSTDGALHLLLRASMEMPLRSTVGTTSQPAEQAGEGMAAEISS